MNKCENCGYEFEGKYCLKCGTKFEALSKSVPEPKREPPKETIEKTAKPSAQAEKTDTREYTTIRKEKTVTRASLAGCMPIHIEIPNGAKKIDGYAFQNSTLQSVIIPKSVKEIGDYAFWNCKQLEFVGKNHRETGLSSLSQMGTGAFASCEKLKRISVCGVKNIPKTAFKECALLTDVNLGDNVKTIGDSAFENCYSLRNIITAPLSAVGNYAFAACHNLETLPSLAKNCVISTQAFKNCSALKEAVLPQGITYCAEGLFQDCVALEHVVLPDELQCVFNNAFRNCRSLCEITLPGSVGLIYADAFRDCPSLKKLIFLGDCAAWHKVRKADGWRENSDFTVVCTDGIL